MSAWGPLTEFSVDIYDERAGELRQGLTKRIDALVQRALVAVEGTEIISHYRFDRCGTRYQGKAPSALVAVLAAVAQGHDPTPLVERMETSRDL